MISRLSVVAVVLSGFVGVAAYADDDWTGLYAGIHPGDGSLDHLSIVPAGGGGYEFLLSTERLGLCDGGPGWAAGTLARSGRSLEVQEETVSCADGSQAATPPGFRLTFTADDDILLI
ncbi:MAG: hypothetical protein AAFW76_10185, partial [Pseudomonadota bacterium]